MKTQDVLDFWFGQPPSNWFRKNPAFDGEIRERFGFYFERFPQVRIEVE